MLDRIQAQESPTWPSPQKVPGTRRKWPLPRTDRVASYRLIEPINGGAMGMLFSAIDDVSRERVALKLLPLGWGESSEAADRLIRGAQAFATLDHPNICKVKSVGVTSDELAYVAMELCEGETLRDKIRRGSVWFAPAVDLCAQVAEGLRAAHALGIVHRDIKPANIMICRRGVAKIVDFGLAKLSSQIDLTRSGSWAGTPAYMSPEQITSREVDQRTDLWSLGATLYHLLTGRYPFSGDNAGAVMYSVLNEDPRPVTDYRPELQSGIDVVVSRCLTKDPIDRYGSARELRSDLLQLISG